LKPIGIVASHATESRATMILNEGMEKEVGNESLTIIENKNGGKVLAVCRGGLGVNDSLKATIYSPGVAYARAGRQPSSAKEFFGFNLIVIGDVSKGKIEQNKLIISPTSTVHLFEKGDNPMSYLGRHSITIGHYSGEVGWKVPLLEEYISYHIGVYGSTGSGKSFLCRYELIPVLRKAGYDVLVFDWKGSDYAPYLPHTISLRDIELDEEAVLSFLESKADYFGRGEMGQNISNYLEEALSKSEWRKLPPEKLGEELKQAIARNIIVDNPPPKGKETSHWADIRLRRLERGFRRIKLEDFETVLGKMGPEEIVRRLRQEHVLVLDMSLGGKEQKLSAFLSLARHLKELMEKKKTLKIALVVDEAPQYCPWDPDGIEEETTEMITALCALGRTYGLSIVLLSQGMAGEIGINAAVRRNLNTQFIGRIHPLDFDEAMRLFAHIGVDPETLLRLPEGHFYFAGKMNPSPVPLLISFQIPEEEKAGGTRRA